MAGLEAKLRAALQDKNSAQMEKAAAERNLKALQGQAGRLTKDLEKKARCAISSIPRRVHYSAERLASMVTPADRCTQLICGPHQILLVQRPSMREEVTTLTHVTLLCVQDAVESKKRETMMVGLKQTQGQVGVLEESLTRVQLELERVSFALQAKTGALAQGDRPSLAGHFSQMVCCPCIMHRGKDEKRVHLDRQNISPHAQRGVHDHSATQ